MDDKSIGSNYDNPSYNADLSSTNKGYDYPTLGNTGAKALPQEKTFGQKFREYPKCVFFVFGNEFCERFSYYGLQAVLTLYFLNILNLGKKDAVQYYQTFGCLCYFTPILGCILADGFIGKFKTILYVSVIYACGNIILSAASALQPGSREHPALDFVGLLVIAIGTGGIKPCVSAFGGDQFKAGQESWLETFFSVFYFCINAGSCISIFLTPILRVSHCNHQDSCYPLAFGVPAALMVLSCVFFVFGSFWYKKNPPQDNKLGEIFIYLMIVIRRAVYSTIARKPYINPYLDNHDCADDPKCRNKGSCYRQEFVSEVKAVGRLLVMYIPLPVFWACYNQEGSKWIIQGTEMKSKIGQIRILPDQMQAVDAILVMVYVPLFSGLIYPMIAKCTKVAALRKMSLGGIIASIAFVITGVIQMMINKSLPMIPDSGTARVTLMNYEACDVNVTIEFWEDTGQRNVSTFVMAQNATEQIILERIINKNNPFIVTTVSAASNTSLKCMKNESHINGTVVSKGAYYIVIAGGNLIMGAEPLDKPTKGEGENYYTFNFMIPHYIANNTNFTLCNPNEGYEEQPWVPKRGCVNVSDPERYITNKFQSFTSTKELLIKPGTWLVYLPATPNDFDDSNFPDSPSFELMVEEEGAIETVTILGPDTTNVSHAIYQLTSPNNISLAYQVPQYVVITIAEVLFSITGLEFSYSQAPASMKSVLQAVWLLCVALGNVIIILTVEVQISENQAYVFFFFAGLMLFVTIIFILLSVYYYDYVAYVETKEEDS